MKKNFLPAILFLFSFSNTFSQSIQLDKSFGNSGIVTTDFGYKYDYHYQTIARQIFTHGDSTYLLVEANEQSYISKRLTNGHSDPAYGNNGYSAPAALVEGFAAIQPDGKILVAGLYGSSFTIVRFDTDGTLDSTMSDDGIKNVPFVPRAIAVQKNGKILIAGSSSGNNKNFEIARYNPNGSADLTFSGDGKQTTDFGFTGEYGSALAIQPDGKIILAGYVFTSGSSTDFAVARYDSTGNLDTTFSDDGKQRTHIGTVQDIPAAVVIQSDGKIIVAGSGIARYNIDGTPDNTFSGDGTQTIDFSNGNDAGYSVIIENGKILMAGDAGTDSIGLVKYNLNGMLDNTFDNDGKYTDVLKLNQGYTVYTGTAVQPDGKVVAAGYTWNGKNYDFAIARYFTNGNLDTTFSNDGRQTTDFDSLNAYGNAIALQSDGKIIIAGVADSNFALVRYNTDGTLDNTFSADGKLTTDMGFNRYDFAQAIAIQNDGKIVAAGASANTFDSVTHKYINDFALARYNNDGTPDNSFSSDGKVTTNVSFNDIAKSVVIQSDGKIVAGGYSEAFGPGYQSSLFAVLRYNSDGSLDNSFSGDGKATAGSANSNYGNALIIHDNKILISGTAANDASDLASDFEVARFNANGTLDNTFNGNGIQSIYIANVVKYASAISVLPDNKIILAGEANGNFTLAGYNADGTADNTFGTNGIKVTEASIKDDGIQSLALADGRLYAAGFGQYPGTLGALARYLVPQAGPLPISIRLSGSLQDEAVLLKWQLSSEQNISYFIAERSADGNIFLPIGKMQAKGILYNSDYLLTDLQPLKQTNFYRIKIISADGKFSYSNTIAVTPANKNLYVRIFPNPATDILFVQASGDNENATIDITDGAGRKVKQIKLVLNKTTSFSIDVNMLPAGIYNLAVHKKTTKEVQGFIKK